MNSEERSRTCLPAQRQVDSSGQPSVCLAPGADQALPQEVRDDEG